MTLNETQQEKVTGVVDRILFQNSENGYTVFVLNHYREPITVTGYLPMVHSGAQVLVQGKWSFHPKFGKQFEAVSCTLQVPTTLVGLKKYLGSGLIKGIGKVYAEKMVAHFGEQILDIIDKHPERLKEINGLGASRVEKITEAWASQKEISSIMVFLQDKGVSPAYAAKIFKQYGKQAIAVINENPYRLAEDVWGIGFKMADKVAQNMGFEPSSVKRIKAGVLFAISSVTSMGSIYAELDELKKKTMELLELDQTEHERALKIAFHELHDAGKIKLISDNNQHFVTLSSYYFSEKGVAARLKNLNAQPKKDGLDIDQIYTQLRATLPHELHLNEDQQRGIMACLTNKVTVITGGPGTGKTTLIKKLLGILEDNHIRYKLAAPTGRAAKRIIEGTGRHALTLHRLLEFDVSTMSFTHNETNALALDFLIVDEASMIDIFLANALLKAVPFNAHLVLIGDVDQLPSVGAGNFLHDLIASQQVATVRLAHIFRQAQDSLIIINAHRVNAGEFPTTQSESGKRDFFFIKENDPLKVQDHLANIFTTTLKRFGIPVHEAMVLVPMHRGIVGTQKINQDLQALINTNGGPSLSHTGTVYKIGDRVMQLKNNYDKAIFNGDIGTIAEINAEDRSLVISFDDRLVPYESDELDEITLSYAISIHKSQGSEYQAAIIPIFTQHFTLLQRNLIYTALTRAKKLCILLGQTKALAMALRNTKGSERKTFLKEFLTTDLQCR
jgi:exodeoxyribonuclease V alpha subunit